MNQSLKLSLGAALLLGLGQCQKKADPSPVDQLPPATQTGANTFGCLVNGQAWTPKGNNGTSNYSVDYGSGPRGEYFNILSYRYPNETNNAQYLIIEVNENLKVGSFSFGNTQQTRAFFDDAITKCSWNSRDSGTTYRRGTLTVTRLDKQAGIISGTFAFTLYNPGCDSIKVTQGRFDKRF